MNSPDVTKFLNETLRPFSERLRAINFELSAVIYAYQTGVGPAVEAAAAADATEVIDDGRLAEGVNQLTVGQASDLMAFVTAVKTLADAAESVTGMAAANRACVRPLRITSIG